MRLDSATWPEVDEYLKISPGIIIPTGSTEQHGPMGLIGTDAICAQQIAERAADIVEAYVAPTIAYTPAPFNTAFPGTLSISRPVFEALVGEILDGLIQQGFKFIYFLNGHGANLAPLKHVTRNLKGAAVRIRSWWEYDTVNELRDEFYGDWEGMHATPSEIAITQATHRTISPGSAATPPKKLSAEYIKKHQGDRHGPPDHHRELFPDGRVGSHSALANPENGKTLMDAAITALANDYLELLGSLTTASKSNELKNWN
jgi:creatinine amidohydrolase